MLSPIRWEGDAVILLDQRALPRETAWIRCTTHTEVAQAITRMVVRGAPAIAISAAYGMALAARHGEDLQAASATLLAARPTAVNLRWALERVASSAPEQLADEAVAIHREDLRLNRALGDHGAALLPDEVNLYHHCNTGALATGGWGTALGIIRSAHAMGKKVHVWVGETRPYLQGARLTAWELMQDGIDHTLVTDSMAAHLMSRGMVDAVVVGCDRVAANGDTANKIGTLSLAVLGEHYGVPLYVAMPTSTLDTRCPDGSHIPIEERSATELRGFAGVQWAPDSPGYHPAFDVTPAALIAGWVTEHGLWRPED